MHFSFLDLNSIDARHLGLGLRAWPLTCYSSGVNMNIEIQVKLWQKASRTFSKINDSIQLIPSHHDSFLREDCWCFRWIKKFDWSCCTLELHPVVLLSNFHHSVLSFLTLLCITARYPPFSRKICDVCNSARDKHRLGDEKKKAHHDSNPIPLENEARGWLPNHNHG